MFEIQANEVEAVLVNDTEVVWEHRSFKRCDDHDEKQVANHRPIIKKKLNYELRHRVI